MIASFQILDCGLWTGRMVQTRLGDGLPRLPLSDWVMVCPPVFSVSGLHCMRRQERQFYRRGADKLEKETSKDRHQMNFWRQKASRLTVCCSTDDNTVQPPGTVDHPWPYQACPFRVSDPQMGSPTSCPSLHQDVQRR